MNNIILEKYDLPLINENLPEEEYKHKNKYRNLYIRLINKCKEMSKDDLKLVYTEKHHILPKCMGGKDVKSNIIEMPIRYHIMAHIVLTIAYSEIPGLRYALMLITSDGNKNNQLKRKEGLKTFSTRLLSTMREDAVKKLKELGRSEEHRRKLRNAMLGKKLSEEQKRKISESGRGLKRSPETRRRISLAQIGKVVSKETREKVSKGHKDKFGRPVIGPDGKVYSTIATAARANNIPPTTLISWVKGIRKDNHGWKFYKEEDKRNLSESD